MGVQDRSPYICAVRLGIRRIAFLELQMMVGEGLPYFAWRVLKTVNA